jgi:hypothetical protein
VTATEADRVAALEDELYEAQVELDELRAQLWLMLHSDDPRRTARVLLALEDQQASAGAEPPARPALRVLEGGRRATPRHRSIDPGRHGLHAV